MPGNSRTSVNDMGIGNRPVTHDSSVAAYNLHRVPVETIVIICLFCAAIAAVIGHTKNRSIGESFLIRCWA